MPASPSSSSPQRPRPSSILQRLGLPGRALLKKWQRAFVESAPEKLAEPMTNPNPQRYFDPEVLARVGFSPLLARAVVEGFISGLHKSPFHGFSVEFADHREYVAGDDLKFIDWPLYARTDH